MIFYFGFKYLYLCGVDFMMEAGKSYAFDQEKGKSGAKSNNAGYAIMNKRFTALQEDFLKRKFIVHNCNPQSGLKAFPFMSFDQAIDEASKECNEKPILTKGMYESPLTKEVGPVG